ncbi:MAG: glycosyl hydrolase [Flammeovirgaceae bacterium TMED32]|nr:MAG: glycosyl hydrolase [Flammeovirgaceae bacterium TMED32]
MKMRTSILIICCLIFTCELQSQVLDSVFNKLKYRSIGPFRGGRANAGTGVIDDPLTYYMGTTGGGVWKTSDAGQHWINCSDGFFKMGSVGAIAVSESHTNVVYVGMGEHAPRGVMTSHGDGVYKSTDAGKTWAHMGLRETQHISRIVIHPRDPNILWVAAQGALNGPNEDRGIFKSTNGGKSWKRTLFVNNLAGASELSLDYHNPDILYAAIWEHMRTPWQVISGGEGSGLYKSSDGGDTWKKIHQGLPEEKGKMAIAVSRANSDWVYALIESDSQQEKGGLFVSKNAGKNWTRISGDHRLLQRAWYYIEITLDPKDENVVYVLSAGTYRSINGGKDWERIRSHHGDYHDLWINPLNSKNMLLTNDGGSEISFDKGTHWSRIDNMPTAQFYRVTTDNMFPYNIYGGQQDNSSVKIASIGLGSSGITKSDWTSSAGGESAFLAFDPDNPVKVMGGSYLGSIDLLDTKARTGTNVKIEPNLYLGLAARDMKYLFNWNAPIVKSVHEPNTYFHGAQYLLRTRDEGISWVVISPDLTANIDAKQGKGGGPYTVEAVGAENYGTLTYVVESKHEKGVIYTGSNDGRVHLTKDNGITWNNVTPKGLPETLVNAIEVSPHDPGTVYLATTRYKFNDYTPGLYKSTNYGKTWKLITSGIPQGAYTKVVREDEKRKDLLFAGTVTGMYASWDGGLNWSPLQLNLPITPITDLAISHDNIVVATQGRSFWILDDLTILRQYDGTSRQGKFYAPAPTYIPNWYSGLNSNKCKGTDLLKGVNPASGMVLYYDLPSLSKETELTLTIKDAQGNIVNTFSSSVDKSYITYEGNPPKKPTLSKNVGLNRFVWNMHYPLLPGVPEVYIEGSYSGHQAIPGNYQLTLTYDDNHFETPAIIQANPLYDLSEAQYRAYHEFMSFAAATYREMTDMTNRLNEINTELKSLLAKMNPTNHNELIALGNSLSADLTLWDGIMVQRLSKAYDDVENFENGFTAHYLNLISESNSPIPKITQGSESRKVELDTEWIIHKQHAERLLKGQVQFFNTACQAQSVGVLFVE